MKVLATGPSGPARRANLALALEQILALGRGQVPAHVVNREAIVSGAPGAPHALRGR